VLVPQPGKRLGGPQSQSENFVEEKISCPFQEWNRISSAINSPRLLTIVTMLNLMTETKTLFLQKRKINLLQRSVPDLGVETPSQRILRRGGDDS
jgi:hypothetical protein